MAFNIILIITFMDKPKRRKLFFMHFNPLQLLFIKSTFSTITSLEKYYIPLQGKPKCTSI